MTSKNNAEAKTELKIRPLGDSITVGRWLGCPDPDGPDGSYAFAQDKAGLPHEGMEEPGDCGPKEFASGYRHYLVDYYFPTPIRLVGANDYNPSTKLSEADQQFHDGHTGWKITNLMTIATEYTGGADIILVHAGTNDLIWGADGETTANRLKVLLQELRQHDPTAGFLIAQIIPVYPNQYSSPLVHAEGLPDRMNDYNARIPQIVEDLQGDGVTCGVVDMHTNMNEEDFSGVDPNTGLEHLSDGVHPYVVGYQKMAERWARAIRELMQW